jgi:hypothetical protein
MVATPDALGEIRISPLEGLIEVSPVGKPALFLALSLDER